MLPYVTKDNAKEIAKKAIESAGVGTTVVANPEDTATADLNKIGINNVIYNISTGGSQVVANPGGVLTDTLSSIAIDGVSYGIQGGASTSGDTLEIKGVLSRDEEEEETIITVSDEDTNKLIQFINSGKRNVKLLVGAASGKSQNYIIPLINCEKYFYEEDDADVLVCSFNLIEGEGQGMLCNLLVYFEREVKHSTGEVIYQGWYFDNAAMSNSFRVSNIHEGKGIDIWSQGSYGGDYIINIDTAGAQTDQVLAYGSNGQTYWKTVSGGGSYTAGDGISIQNNTIGVKCSWNSGLTAGPQGLMINMGSASQNQVLTYDGCYGPIWRDPTGGSSFDPNTDYVKLGNSAQVSTTSSGIAIGKSSYNSGSYSRAIALGVDASTYGMSSVAIGPYSKADQSTGLNSIAIGCLAVAQSDCIQLGQGTNEETGTFKVYNTKVVDSNGKIATQNLSTNNGSTGQVLAVGSSGNVEWKNISSGATYTGSNGIYVDNTNNIIESKLGDGLGLNYDGNISVNVDYNTIAFGSSGELRLKTGEGLTYDGNGVRLNISSYKGLSKGLTVNSNGLTIETSDHSLYGSDNYGLCVNVDPYRGLYTDNNGLGIKISGASSGDVLSYNGSNILWTKPGGALTKYEVNMETLLNATTNVQKLSKIKGNYYISYSGSTHSFGHISSWNDNGLYYIYDGSTSRAGVGSGGFSNMTVVYYNDSNLFE